VEFLDGVHAQPEYLERSRGLVHAALRDIDTAALRHGTTLAVGIGASGHAAAGFAARLRERGAGAYPFSPGDGPPGRADCYVAITYSGRSAETVRLMESLGAGPGGAREGARIAVTGHPGAPIGEVVDQVVALGGATDTAVSTLSYTATVQALGLLADAAWGAEAEVWRAVPGHAAAVLGDRTLAERIAAAFEGVACVDVVGSGMRVGSAGAAALLLREAAHLPAAAYAVREYLHGPLEVAGPGRGALVFGEGRAAALAGEMAGWGSPTVLVTADPSVPEDPGGPVVVRLPELPEAALAVLDLLPVQVAAAELARRSGLPIALRHMPADTKLPAVRGDAG
jgi:glucosamine--fructose-6-phosphate aminotransferase (isomerizing)